MIILSGTFTSCSHRKTKLMSKLSQKRVWSPIWSQSPSTENGFFLKSWFANQKIWPAESICQRNIFTLQRLSGFRVLTSQAEQSTPGSKSAITARLNSSWGRTTYHFVCPSTLISLLFSSSTDPRICSVISQSPIQIMKASAKTTLKKSDWSTLQIKSGSKRSAACTKRLKSW